MINKPVDIGRRFEQKTLDGGSIIVGSIYKVVRIEDEERFVSFLDHDKWTVEYTPDKWTDAPHHSLIYGFNNAKKAEEWGKGVADKYGDYELWKGLAVVLVEQPLVTQRGNKDYEKFWTQLHVLAPLSELSERLNQLIKLRDSSGVSKDLEDLITYSTKTNPGVIGAARIKLQQYICKIERWEDYDDDDC